MAFCVFVLLGWHSVEEVATGTLVLGALAVPVGTRKPATFLANHPTRNATLPRLGLQRRTSLNHGARLPGDSLCPYHAYNHAHVKHVRVYMCISIGGRNLHILLGRLPAVLVVVECAALIFIAAVAVYQDVSTEGVFIFCGQWCK